MGTIFGMTFTVWVAIGSYVIGNQKSDQPLPYENCPAPPMGPNGTAPRGPPKDERIM